MSDPSGISAKFQNAAIAENGRVRPFWQVHALMYYKMQLPALKSECLLEVEPARELDGWLNVAMLSVDSKSYKDLVGSMKAYR